MVTTMQHVKLPLFRMALLKELKATMEMAVSSGWPVARIIHREVMGKIE